MFQAADRNQAAVSRTYHSAHAVRGGGADRVVVGVCCCIDSAVAAWNREDGHWSVGTFARAGSMLQPQVNFQVTSAINYFPRRPPGPPHHTRCLRKESSKVGELYLSFHCHLD